MKALTMTQPWASLVAIGANRIETRSWGTGFRGVFAIHAAKGFPREARDFCDARYTREALARGGYDRADQLPLGAVVAIAYLDDLLVCDRSTLGKIRRASAAGDLPPHEADFGGFSAGRYGFILSRVQRLREPVPARGMLGFWEMPAEVLEHVEAQLPTQEGVHFEGAMKKV